MHSDRWLAAVALVGVAGVHGCALARVDVPVFEPGLVVHAVLTNTDTMQMVLVERTLTGVVPAPRGVPPGDGTRPATDPSPLEPILTDGGVAERGATVEMLTPGGEVVRFRERSSYSVLGDGAGIYIAPLRGATLVRGGTYQLRVTTVGGEVVTGWTVVPAAPTVATGPPTDFQRSRDTLDVQWPGGSDARAFQVRIDTPYGPWVAFTTAQRLRLDGGLRNTDASRLPRVFIPGFRQLLSVGAVDANLYDYYRTSTSGGVGAGLASSLQGARGVFGSFITVSRRTIRVTDTVDDPIEGGFTLTLGNLGYIYGGAADARSMTLYVESPPVAAGQAASVSGEYRTAGGAMRPVIGSFTGSRLRLAFLSRESLTDTLDILTAELRGDSLVGTFSRGAPAVYRR